MISSKARVCNGRLIVDGSTDLPEGTEVELVPLEDRDDLDDEERLRLHQALEASEDDVARGRVRPAEDVLAGGLRRSTPR